MSQTQTVIHSNQAPEAIGPYSQARRVGQTVYLSGQIPLNPQTGELVSGDFSSATRQVFENLKAVAEAAGGSLDDVVKLNIYVTDLGHFQTLNAIMMEYFKAPYPARAAIEVAGLPKGAEVEMDGILVLP